MILMSGFKARKLSHYFTSLRTIGYILMSTDRLQRRRLFETLTYKQSELRCHECFVDTEIDIHHMPCIANHEKAGN